jgi:hypothetical protein
MFTFAGDPVVGLDPAFFTTELVPAEFVVFGRLRLFTVVGALLLRGVVLGRVVRNAPRTSSSCWAKAEAGTKPASAISTLKKITFILIGKTSPSN